MSCPASSLRKSRRFPAHVKSDPHHDIFQEENISKERSSCMANPFRGGRPLPIGLPEVTKSPRVSQQMLEDIRKSFVRNIDLNKAEYSSSTSNGLFGSSPENEATLPESSSQLETPLLNSLFMKDDSLISSLVGRLQKLENMHAKQTKEIKAKDKRIKVLEEKNSILCAAREQNLGSEEAKLIFLEEKCLNYQKKTEQMEQFLSDYGMIWVGENERGANKPIQAFNDDTEEACHSFSSLPLSFERKRVCESSSTSNTTSESDLQFPLNKSWEPRISIADPHFPDFDLLVSNVNELNQIAGEGQQVISHWKKQAHLKTKENVPLAIFKNGIMLWQGPFRTYDERMTRQFVLDLLDGYFPSELRDTYPNGVPFLLSDKRDVNFVPRDAFSFIGPGHQLGEPLKSKNSFELGSTLKNLEIGGKVTSCLPGRVKSVNQLLDSLPETKIVNGKVMSVRREIASHLTEESSANETVVIVPNHIGKDISRDVVTVLRIRFDRMCKIFVVTLLRNESIRILAKHIASHSNYDVGRLQFFAGFPCQRLTEWDKALEDLGLVPTATLHVQLA